MEDVRSNHGHLFIFGTAGRAIHRMKLAGKPDSDSVRFTFVKSQSQLKKTEGRFCAVLKGLAK